MCTSGNRLISSQTCCTVVAAPGAVVMGRKLVRSTVQMAFLPKSAVYHGKSLVHVQRSQDPSGLRRLCGRVLAVGNFLLLFSDKSWQVCSG